MKVELYTLKLNHAWSTVNLRTGKHPIGCKWACRIKYHADGTIERYRARLVAQGYTQLEGVDYFDTFFRVVYFTNVRTLLALATIKGWGLEQLDVNNVFLHGDLNEEVYMFLPTNVTPTVTYPNRQLVCRFDKSLYGPKQGSRQWYSPLSSAFISLGYPLSNADHSFFFKKTFLHFISILIYVGDIVISGNDPSEITSVKQFRNDTFEIKDLEPLRYFLGLEIARSPHQSMKIHP